jgi:hypothetical protein
MSTHQKQFEEKPHQRLITQNLLVSAAIYETSQPMNIVALENLCHAIDVFCLYDNAIILGHGASPRQFKSEFLDAFEKDNFISIANPTIVEINNMFRTASGHLAAALKISDPHTYVDLFERAWNTNETFIVVPTPDEIPQKGGWEALLRDEQKIGSREHTFVARTFLQLAYADCLNLALTPDVQRNPILQYAADREEVFRGRIVQVVREKYADFFGGLGDPNLRGKVSPCAAIVFSRALRKDESGNKTGNKSRIPYEMMWLREQLTSTRKSLRTLEQEIYSNQDSYKQREALNKWNKTVDELAHSYLETPWNVSAGKEVRTLLSFAQPLLDIAALITHPFDSDKWKKVVEDLPVTQLEQFFRQRSIIDLYDVLQPPSLFDLKPLVESLFGQQVFQNP